MSSSTFYLPDSMAQVSLLKEFSDSLSGRMGPYPENLVSTDTSPHRLKSYLARLNATKSKLFCNDGSAKLKFLTWEEQGRQFQKKSVQTEDQLKIFYGIDENFVPGIKDPQCRFVLIHARNSRDRLLISYPMMSLLFTYHQVIPGFLDFVFTFGRRERGQELYYGGFRSESSTGMAVSTMGRSGRDFRLCYNLISVERNPQGKSSPWSIRQTAIHHSFDIVTGCASWIIVKGDQMIEERVEKATNPAKRMHTSHFDTKSHSFTSTLNMHLVCIDWSGENWQSYIDYLDEEGQRNTRQILSADVNNLQRSITTAAAVAPSAKLAQRRPSQQPSLMPEKDSQVLSSSPYAWTNFLGKLRQRINKSNNAQLQTQQEGEAAGGDNRPGFRFEDLQTVQYLEERTNGAILVININLNVIGEMKVFYQEQLREDKFSDELGKDCVSDVEQFIRRVSNAENDLRLQKSRAESLVQVLGDRKRLLEYQNYKASFLSAYDMQMLAHQTQRETVSMRIITLVTLFFLPATFICTLMTTDIVRWESQDGHLPEISGNKGAFEFFIVITVPLSCCTYLGWWLFHRRLKRAHEKAKSSALDSV